MAFKLDSAVLTVYDEAGKPIPIPSIRGRQGEKGDKGDAGLNGKDGKDAPQIDDTQASPENPWSGEKVQDFVAESVCSPFAESGPIVAGELFTNSKMGMKLNLEPIQEGTGDPSPENVRPIKARVSVGGVHCGKNLCKNVSFTTDRNFYFGSTKELEWPIFFVKGLTYTFVAKSDGVRRSLYMENAMKQKERLGDFSGEAKFTVSLDTGFYRLFAYSSAADLTISTYSDVQLELGSTPTPYAPYHGEPFTVNLGQEVYGGTVDLQTGEGEVTSVTEEVAPERWRTSGNYFVATLSIRGKRAPNQTAFCNRERYEYNYSGNNVIVDANSLYVVTELANRYGTLEKWQESLRKTPLVICYELETPIPFTLSPDQLIQLRAYGNGDTVYTADPACTIDLTGFKDPKAEIKSLTDRIAALEGAATSI